MRILPAMMKHLTYLIAALWLLIAGACSQQTTSPDTAIDDAEQAFAEGSFDLSQKLCVDLLNRDADTLSEQQLGRLAILFMKLSENTNTEENIADATLCFRKAWKLSTDSLHGFSSTLQPEDVPRFVNLSRLGGALDFPPDLSDDNYPEDSTAIIINDPSH